MGRALEKTYLPSLDMPCASIATGAATQHDSLYETLSETRRRRWTFVASIQERIGSFLDLTEIHFKEPPARLFDVHNSMTFCFIDQVQKRKHIWFAPVNVDAAVSQVDQRQIDLNLIG